MGRLTMSATTNGRKGPLTDLRVIEMGQLLAGPFCGQLLADFGAEVIKIEPPGVGDPMRDLCNIHEKFCQGRMAGPRPGPPAESDFRRRTAWRDTGVCAE